MLQEKLKTRSSKQGTKVRLPYDTSQWTNASIWALETFGFPGYGTYYCEFHEEAMNFYFSNEEDAIRFALRWL